VIHVAIKTIGNIIGDGIALYQGAAVLATTGICNEFYSLVLVFGDRATGNTACLVVCQIAVNAAQRIILNGATTNVGIGERNIYSVTGTILHDAIADAGR
jgi:hypothetical protein